MIAFDGVTVRYPRADRDAVHDVSLEARAGRITAVVGPNGSGKSTLVRALLHRRLAVGGRIRLHDIDVASLDPRALARTVAIVPQREEPLFPLRVHDFVMLGRYPHLGAWRGAGAADHTAVAEALERCEVEALAGRTTDALSGGEWQRVRLARALAQGAQALVLDEPTAFQDIAHEMATFELLSALARDGRAVLLVSHQLNLVARFADAMILLHAGRVAAIGAPDEVMRGDVLERVYEWPLVVSRDPAIGAPALIPLRRSSRP